MGDTRCENLTPKGVCFSTYKPFVKHRRTGNYSNAGFVGNIDSDLSGVGTLFSTRPGAVQKL
jgi:hypothetical protein